MILLLSSCALITLSSTKRSHPELEGVVQGPGVQEPLRIKRDALGVPHVEAASEWDAWYGLGFVHAQDRLFQADLTRHVAQGRLSEWIGEDAVELDGFMRSLDLRGRASRTLERSAPAARDMVNAYTRGFNDGVGSLKTLPVEYRLLGVPFEPWRAEDCAGIGWLQSWNLADNPDHELAAVALRGLDRDLLDALTRSGPESPPPDAFWDELRTRDFGEYTPGFLAFTDLLGGRPEAPEASNNWVVGGGRTASGKPIVANDPHLSQSVPSLWYVAHVQGGPLNVAGATLAGSPGFPIGHNERLAWGLTNVMADLVDVAVLEPDGDGVVIGSRREPLRTVRSAITPKGGEPVERDVAWTELGPVINREGDVVLALRWHALELDDRLHQVLHALAVSGSTADARDAVAGLPLMVAQNVAMADVDGSWGWQVVGSIPKRKAHTGRVPYPAGDPNHGWDGWHTELPGEDAPERGFAVTANSRPDHPAADALSTSYVPPHRFDRITTLLDGLDAATPSDMVRVQTDLRDGAADRHLHALLQGVEATGTGATCLEALETWDRQSTPDSRGAAVWAAFQPKLLEVALRDRLTPEQVGVVLDLSCSGRNPLDGSVEDRSRWEVLLPDRVGAVQTALTETCAELTATWGDPSGWSWGAMHPLRLRHPFGSRSKLLSGWNMREVPFGGSGATVAAAGYSWTADSRAVGGMASLRIVMPLDDLGASTLGHPGGQGGQPGSPHYASHFDAFVAGEPLPLWFDPEDIRANAVNTLVVSP